MVTCSRRLENPAGLRRSPSLFFLGFWNFSDANEGRGTSQPLYKGGRAGRPAAGRPGGPAAPLPGDRPHGPICNFFRLFFAEKPLPPGTGAAGVYFYNFPNQKYIFIKNRNKKYKNKKTAGRADRKKKIAHYLGRTVRVSIGPRWPLDDAAPIRVAEETMRFPSLKA